MESIKPQFDIGLLRIAYWEDRMRNNLRDLPEYMRTAECLAEALKKRYEGRAVADENTSDFHELLHDISKLANENLVAEAAMLFQSFLKNHYTLAELEVAMKDPRFDSEQGGSHEVINKLVMVEFVRKGEEEISEIKIHLSPKASLGAKAVLSLFLEGLKTIADRFDTDSRYSRVSTIAGESWLIKDYPFLVNRWGFELDAERPERATISKIDFLQRF